MQIGLKQRNLLIPPTSTGKNSIAFIFFRCLHLGYDALEIDRRLFVLCRQRPCYGPFPCTGDPIEV